MQNQEYLDKFKENLAKIAELNPKDLIRREELGTEMNFADAEDDFEQAINLFKKLNDIDTSLLPNEKLNSLNTQMNDFLSAIDSIKTFSATQGLQERNSRISRIKGSSYNTWYNAIAPVVSFCTKAGTDYEALQRKAREAVENLTKVLSEAAKEREEAKAEIQETLAAVKKAAAEVGVTQHTTNFKDAADAFETGKKSWAITIGSLLLVIIMYSFIAFWYCPIEMKEPYFYVFLQAALPRFTGLVALFYALFVATSNYKAQAHNYIVNKNKQNALSTFETFVKASDNDEIKNAVLLQTTKAIFSNTQSGYLKNESMGDEGSQIIEIVKDVSKIAKP